MFDQLAIFSRRRDPRARAPPERSFRITNERARIQAGKFFVSLPPAIHSTSSVLLRRKLAAAQNSSLIATIVSQRAQFMRRLPHPPRLRPLPSPLLLPPPPARRLGFIARSPQANPLTLSRGVIDTIDYPHASVRAAVAPPLSPPRSRWRCRCRRRTRQSRGGIACSPSPSPPPSPSRRLFMTDVNLN